LVHCRSGHPRKQRDSNPLRNDLHSPNTYMSID
jgi:hypothetical protein